MGSTPTTHPIEKALASARAFSVKFVPAERVKCPTGVKLPAAVKYAYGV